MIEVLATGYYDSPKRDLTFRQAGVQPKRHLHNNHCSWWYCTTPVIDTLFSRGSTKLRADVLRLHDLMKIQLIDHFRFLQLVLVTQVLRVMTEHHKRHANSGIML